MTAELCAALLSWAVTLSGYPHPGDCPQVIQVEQKKMEELACYGRKCRVLGWYPGSGHSVYINEALGQRLNNSTYARSILLHEMVHYLQWVGSDRMELDCETAVLAEREAYRVQSEYITRQGVYRPVGQALPSFRCS
jgi:hypothetical protein